jgi:ribosomal protein S18 acetylase RimI-like enzyme
MSTVEVRSFSRSDIEDYRTIRLAALRDAPEAFTMTYEVEAALPRRAFEQRLSSSVVFGAFLEGRVVGLVRFQRSDGPKDAHKGFLRSLYVRPEVRRCGVAAALIEALLRVAREQVEHVVLTVVRDNEPAIALYRKFGFEVYGIEPRALKSAARYTDKVLMVCFLGQPTTQ